jgi:pSer/pThr/pTyr-binding forkhead associated (FHA) protein
MTVAERSPRVKLEFVARRDKPDYFLTKPVTTLGRAPDNDVVFCDAEEDRVVSGRHCCIENAGGGWRIRDLGASNKLFVNGEEVAERRLSDADMVQLGKRGPRVRVVFLDHPRAARELLRATRVIIRDKLSTRRYRIGLAVLAVFGIGMAVLYSLTHQSAQELLLRLQLEREALEKRIATTETEAEKLRLIAQLNRVVLEREQILAALPEGERPKRTFVEEEVVRLMQRFRETTYAVPELFVQRVNHFLSYYTETPRGRMDIELGRRNLQGRLARIKALFEEKKIPGEMAYVGFVESKFDDQAENLRSGARGMWQLLPGVAREQGLVVQGAADERTHFEKATVAARGLILNLISVFGVRSFMLVLAAYNAGDARLRARLKKLENPIEQRDFWTLVRLGLLAEETNNYIPKFVASAIVFEHPERFGFAR